MINKNFLAFDGTDDVVLYKCVLRQSNEETQKKQDDIENRLDEQKNKAELPRYLKVIQFIFLIVGVIFTISAIRSCNNMEDDGFIAFFIKTWWVWLVGIGSLIVAYVIEKLQKSKMKQVSESEDYKELSEDSQHILEESFAELNVPSNAVSTDLFVSYFKVNASGKRVKLLKMYDCDNLEFKLFVEDGKLCLADMSIVAGIPLENVTEIEKINKSMVFVGWNKDEAYNSEKYKQYKITANNRYGLLYVKPYYVLKFTIEDKEYGLYFPSYELKTILSLTGLKDPDENVETDVINEENK